MLRTSLTGAPNALLRGAVAILAILALLAPMDARAQTSRAADAFSSVAFVDGSVITNYDVEQRARLLTMLGAPKEGLRERALEEMIDDTLKRKAASRAGIEISPEQMSEALENFARANNVTQAQLDARLRKAGVHPATLERYIETQLMWTSLIRRDYGPRAQVSDLELEDEIRSERLDAKVTLELGEIAIPYGKDPEAVRALIEDIAAQINAGADFAAMARKHSRSPTARRGGNMGKVPAERLPPPLLAELNELEPGKVTRPLSVPNGVALLTVLSREETPIELTDEDRERIRAQLLERRLALYADGRLQELRADAFIDRK